MWRSTTFRFAALVFALQVVTVAILLVGLGAILRDQSNRDAIATATTIRDDLLATYAQGGSASLERAIRLRASQPVGTDAVLLLMGRSGQRLAGNLAAWPATVTFARGYRETTVRRAGRPSPEAVLVNAIRLGGGERLLTGVGVQSQRQLLALLERASLLALLLGLVFAALAAWLAARLIVGRLRTTISTLEAVQAGDLTRRAAVDRSGDAFDTLGADVNRTLDRVSALIDELKIATDGLAHDLKSPLTRMRAALERAIAETRDPVAQQAIERALAENERLMAIVQTALSISRAEAGIGRDSFAPVDLDEMLETIAEIYSPLVEEQGRSIEVQIGDKVVLPVNRQLLGQALGNLMDNAIRYGDGAITLALRAEATVVAIEVRDRGAGIAEGMRTEALRRFGRLDAARGGTGAGLGLTLVQAVAHLHGGTVILKDAAPGLQVIVRLPRT